MEVLQKIQLKTDPRRAGPDPVVNDLAYLRAGIVNLYLFGRRDTPNGSWVLIDAGMPGHTPGHVSLFREVDRTLIVGDAFVTTKQESATAVLTQRPELHGRPAYYTPDWESARRSVQRLAALEPWRVATGHGPPMEGPEMLADLQKL